MSSALQRSPLDTYKPQIQGKVENGRVYCECGAFARDFTVRKEGITKGKVFMKCGNNDACGLFLWKDHISRYDKNGKLVPETASPSTPRTPTGTPQWKSGVRGRSTPTSTPSKRKPIIFDDDDVTEEEPSESDLSNDGSPTKRPTSAKRHQPDTAKPPSRHTFAKEKKSVIDNEEEQYNTIFADDEPIIVDPPSPSPQKRTTSLWAPRATPVSSSSSPFGQKTPSSNRSTFGSPNTPGTPSASPNPNPIADSLDALKSHFDQSHQMMRKEAEKQARLLSAANKKADTNQKLLTNANKQIEELKDRIRLLEEENAVWKNAH